MILLLRVFVLNFCTSPGTSWSQRKLRRMSFGETTSTELVLPSRALSWHLLRQSQPLLLPSQPTPIPQPIGKKQWNLWITKFQSSIKCWNAGTEISKFCTLLHSTGPWMMLRMELETKRTSSSQNSKRWSSSSLMSLIHFHSSLQKHLSIFRLPAKTCRKQMRRWKSLVLQRRVEKPFPILSSKYFTSVSEWCGMGSWAWGRAEWVRDGKS